MAVFRRVRVTPAVKLAGVMAAEFANYDDGAEIRPGSEILAAVAGEMAPLTALRALAKLRDLGLLWRYVEGRKYGRRAVADCYRLTLPSDLLTRVPLLTPDYEVPDQVISDQVIRLLTMDGEHAAPVDNRPDHVTADHLISDHLISDARSPDLRVPEHLISDQVTYPVTTPLTNPDRGLAFSSRPVENSDSTRERKTRINPVSADEQQRHGAALARFLRDHDGTGRSAP